MKTRIKEWFPALSVVILFTLLGFFIGWGIRSNFKYQDVPTGKYEFTVDIYYYDVINDNDDYLTYEVFDKETGEKVEWGSVLKEYYNLGGGGPDSCRYLKPIMRRKLVKTTQ